MVIQHWLKHFMLSAGLFLVAAIICAWMQNQYSIDKVGILVFLLFGVFGCIFSGLYAVAQVKWQHSLLHTFVVVLGTVSYLVVLQYLELNLNVDIDPQNGNAIISNILQKLIKSPLSFWLLFIFPVIISLTLYKLKTKSQSKT